MTRKNFQKVYLRFARMITAPECDAPVLIMFHSEMGFLTKPRHFCALSVSQRIFLIVCIVFSASEAEESKSSIVAKNVGHRFPHTIRVKTVLPSTTVLTDKALGVLRLSGDIASDTAFAVFISSYLSAISAFILVSSYLVPDQLVNELDKITNFFDWNLSAGGNVVAAAFAGKLFGSNLHDLS